MTGEERVFNNTTDRMFFSNQTDLTSEITYFIHVSDAVQKALQQSGVFSNWVFQPTEPTDTTLVWVQNDVDPGIVRVYDAPTTSWVTATFQRVFNITSVMTIDPWSNTQSYNTGNVVRASNNFIYVALTPTGPPNPPVDPTTGGQVAWELLSPQLGSANEWTARQTFSANVSWPGDRPTGPGGFDLDTLTTPGRYSIDDTRDTNIPGSITTGILEVWQREEQTLRAQVLFGVDNTIWYRTGDQNPIQWEAWRLVIFDFSQDHTFTGTNTFDGLININRNAVWESIASVAGNRYDLDTLIVSGRYLIDGTVDTNLPGTETSGLLEVTRVDGDGLIAQVFTGGVSVWYRRGTVTGSSVVWGTFVQFATAAGGGFDFTADHIYTGRNRFQGRVDLENMVNVDANADWPAVESTPATPYDLDTLIIPGRYGIDSTRDTNLPTGTTTGVLEVQTRTTPNFYAQIFYTDADAFYRSSTQNPIVWSAWAPLVTVFDFTANLTLSGNNILNGTTTLNGLLTVNANATWLAPASTPGNRFNLATLTTPGRYWVTSDDAGFPGTDTPGFLEITQPSGADFRSATFVTRNSVYFRQAIGAGLNWDAWRELARSDLTVSQDSETGALDMPSGTTAQRPASPEAGWTRWNSTTEMLEVYNGTDWTAIGSSGLFPIGTILPALSTNAPPGTLRITTARQTVSRTTYSALWAHIQTSGNLAASETGIAAYQYGPGDGSTTFTIPGLDGVFLRASGTNAALLGFGQTDAIRNITGNARIDTDFGLVNGNNPNNTIGAFQPGARLTNGNDAIPASMARNVLEFDASNVVPTAADNRPANATVNYFIVAFQSLASPELLNATNIVNQVNSITTNGFSNRFVSTPETYVPGTLYTFNHGLGAIPDLVQMRLRCLVADIGVSVGEEFMVNPSWSSFDSFGRGFHIRMNDTQIVVRASTFAPFVVNGLGTSGTIVSQRWAVIVRAWT